MSTNKDNSKYILKDGSYIRTFNNTSTDPQWLTDIIGGSAIGLWYYPTLRQVVLRNESINNISWLGSGKVAYANGQTVDFAFPATNSPLITVLTMKEGYFSFNGEYDANFSATVTNSFVRLKDVEIKYLVAELTHIYHFDLNNTCLENVNTVQISPISMTAY